MSSRGACVSACRPVPVEELEVPNVELEEPTGG